MKIALIPLDERPANTRYPQMVGAVARVTVQLPPQDCLSRFRDPAPVDRLASWLLSNAAGFDAVIISIEMLVYGGLIPSRISDESLETVLGRLEVLRELRRNHPQLKLYAFNVITRISRHDDATEEPDYWGAYGSKLFRLSQLLDQSMQGKVVQPELDDLYAQIPRPHVDDFLWRRQRNHQVNVGVLALLQERIFDVLVLSSDDTSEYGLSSAEKRILQSHGEPFLQSGKLLMYPGADEVGCVLLARFLHEAHNMVPRVDVRYLYPAADVVAPFEDVPVRSSVERQLRAAGAANSADSDLVLYVNPPVSPEAEWVGDAGPDPRMQARVPFLKRSVALMAEAVNEGRRVAVADVAYANGASHTLMHLLLSGHLLNDLTAFGGWNTAGNTLGSVIAQLCAVKLPDSDLEANRRCLLHRLVEDWGYQTVVRDEVRTWLEQSTGQREPGLASLEATQARIADGLERIVREIAPDFRLVNVRLPWARTFEVDFELVRR